MSDATVSLSILAAAVVVLFVWNRFPVELVAVGAALALFFSGVLTLGESLAGFGDPAVILIAALFVVSEGLDATGVTTWLGRTLVEKTGGSSRRLLLFTMLLSAGLTALIGLNGTVAALLPMAVMVAVRRGYPTSQLLMPLAFIAVISFACESSPKAINVATRTDIGTARTPIQARFRLINSMMTQALRPFPTS